MADADGEWDALSRIRAELENVKAMLRAAERSLVAIEAALRGDLPVGSEPWMTTNQAAQYAPVPAQRIRQWARDGLIEHGRDGRTILVKASAIDAYLLGDRRPEEFDPNDVDPRVLELLASEDDA